MPREPQTYVASSDDDAASVEMALRPPASETPNIVPVLLHRHNAGTALDTPSVTTVEKSSFLSEKSDWKTELATS
ncbi:hypothetical protein, partial [Staphylococcus aureus]|uniref:hypothetical protein n=1 Tax=Staphylococcus aureus TaxID=1280 RepID=UPI001CAA8515